MVPVTRRHVSLFSDVEGSICSLFKTHVWVNSDVTGGISGSEVISVVGGACI